MLRLAQPKVSWTILRLTFFLARSVAQVCLRSWKRMSGEAGAPRYASGKPLWALCQNVAWLVTAARRRSGVRTPWPRTDVPFSLSLVRILTIL